MRIMSCVIAVAVLLPPVIGCRAVPPGAHPPAVNKKRVVFSQPAAQPLWFIDLQQWLEKHPLVKARAIIGTGDGFNQSEARRKAFRAAVARGNIPKEDYGALKLLENWVIGYADSSYTINALYEYAKPGAAEELEKGARKLCEEMLAGIPPAKAPKLKTVAVGSFCYKNTGFHSELGDLLRTTVLGALRTRLGEAAVGRETLLQKLKGDAPLVMEVLDPDYARPGGEAVVDALITGSFWPTRDRRTVLVQASIKEPATGALLSNASASVSTQKIDAQIAPRGTEAAQENLSILKGLREKINLDPDGSRNFEVKLSADGARQVWKKGEKLFVHFCSDRDSFLNLFHIDCDGRIQLLFPNQWHQDSFIKGGQTYTIPAPDMNFDFTVKPPFGVDIIMAVATAARTPGFFEFRPGKDVAFRGIGGADERGIEVVARRMASAVGSLPGDQKAEALITITTVAGKSGR